MEKKDELKNKDLDSVSGGSSNLDNYLKTLVGKDKDKMTVDYGTGVSLDLDPSIDYDDVNNVHIIKREKPDAELTEDTELSILKNK